MTTRTYQEPFRFTLFNIYYLLFACTLNLGLLTPIKYYYVLDKSGSLLAVGFAYSALGMGSILSLTLNPLVPKYLNYRSIFLLGLIFAFTGMLLYIFAENVVYIVVGRVIYGLFFGITLSLSTTIIGLTSYKDERQTVFIHSQLIMGCGFVLGSLATGAFSFLDESHSAVRADKYTAPAWLNIGALVLSVIGIASRSLFIEPPPEGLDAWSSNRDQSLTHPTTTPQVRLVNSTNSNESSAASVSTPLLTDATDSEEYDENATMDSSSAAVKLRVSNPPVPTAAGPNPTAATPTTPPKSQSSIILCLFIDGFVMFVLRFHFAAFESYMTAFSSPAFGWEDLANSVLFAVLNFFSMCTTLGSFFASRKYSDEVHSQIVVLCVGVVGMLMLLNMPSQVLFVAGCIVWYSCTIAPGMAWNKVVLSRLVAHVPKEKQLIYIGYSSIFADFGRLLGPIWVVMSCGDTAAAFKDDQVCTNFNWALTGMLGLSGVAIVLLLIFRGRILRDSGIATSCVSCLVPDQTPEDR